MPHLHHEFADHLPELCRDWQAAETPEPQLLCLNEQLARDLGLDPEWLRSPEGVGFLCGTTLPKGARPVAMGYAGHQFGQLSPRLGDGRALLLGEIKDTQGNLRDIHVKGSGPTKFSHGGDGWGALGPMLREFLISEAMHALGVPTTRALAVITTGRKIARERVVPAALVVRVASSHIRIGSFQYAQLIGGEKLTRTLAEYTRTRHYPDAADARGVFTCALDAQLSTVAQWMRLGFIHGVMNTDNTTLSGETIDYGPCAFLDEYDEHAVFSSIDHGGRYRYRNQPHIIGWNFARLAEAMLPSFDDDPEQAVDFAQATMDGFQDRWRTAQSTHRCRAIGVAYTENNTTLADDFYRLVDKARPDLTTVHRALVAAAETTTHITAAPSRHPQDQHKQDPRQQQAVLELARPLGATEQAHEWIAAWLQHAPDSAALAQLHPVVIPRNHLVEKALRAATDGDMAPFEELLAAVTDPFNDKHPENFRTPAPVEFSESYQTFCGT